MRAVIGVVAPIVKLEVPIAIVQVSTNRHSWKVEEKHSGRLLASWVMEAGDEDSDGD